MPEGLRDKYFAPVDGRHALNLPMRRALIFGRHDLVHDAPISRVFRNTLMYLNAETQSGVLARLHFALKDDGFMFLGRAEMLLTHADLFTPVNMKCRVFSKVPKGISRGRLVTLDEAGDRGGADQPARQAALRELVFEGGPAQLVVDPSGALTLANEQARALFGIHPEDLGRPFADLEVSYRPVDLRTPINEACADHRSVFIENVQQALPDETSTNLHVQVSPFFDDAGNERGVGITFVDVTRRTELESELQRSAQELETAYEDLQSSNEELQTSNEQLQSTVEELETTNEELQSSNEELETMNEELQSTVEELEPTNEELRRRTEELDGARAFLESIFTNLSSGVVVVDRQLAIREWNHRAEDLWGLREQEVRGQSLLNLDSGLPVEKLKKPIASCLEGKSDRREVVVEATNRRGRAIMCRICLGPLRSPEGGEREGVILLMDETDADS